jgi:hypothetical protein
MCIVEYKKRLSWLFIKYFVSYFIAIWCCKAFGGLEFFPASFELYNYPSPEDVKELRVTQLL